MNILTVYGLHESVVFKRVKCVITVEYIYLVVVLPVDYISNNNAPKYSQEIR